MRVFLNILTGLAIVFALFSMGYIIWVITTESYGDGSGMVMLGLTLWGSIATLIAFVLGFIGRVWDRRAGLPVSLISNLGIVIGVLAGIAAIALRLFAK